MWSVTLLKEPWFFPGRLVDRHLLWWSIERSAHTCVGNWVHTSCEFVGEPQQDIEFIRSIQKGLVQLLFIVPGPLFLILSGKWCQERHTRHNRGTAAEYAVERRGSRMKQNDLPWPVGRAACTKTMCLLANVRIASPCVSSRASKPTDYAALSIAASDHFHATDTYPMQYVIVLHP